MTEDEKKEHLENCSTLLKDYFDQEKLTNGECIDIILQLGFFVFITINAPKDIVKSIYTKLADAYEPTEEEDD